MKTMQLKSVKQVVLLLVGSIFVGCYESPDFADTPSIAFENVTFKEVGGNTDADSLNITFYFEDGDGDLGLDDSYLTGDFKAGSYFVKTAIDGEMEPYDPTIHLAPNFITFSDTRLASFAGKLPPYEIPFQCTNWKIKPEIRTDFIVNDTLYYEPNINHGNLFLEFYTKSMNSAGAEFEKFDWVTDPLPGQCGQDLVLRFPVLEQERVGPISGTLTYSLVINRIPEIFKDKFLKLKIQIQDRALNKSNEVETPEFTLAEILVK